MNVSKKHDWTHVHRQEDGEHVGWLEQHADGRVTARTLLGHALYEGSDLADAEDRLAAQGLAEVARAWNVRLPAVLAGEIDVRDPAAEWNDRRCVVTEIRGDVALLRPAYPAPEEAQVQVSVALPADDVLFS